MIKWLPRFLIFEAQQKLANTAQTVKYTVWPCTWANFVNADVKNFRQVWLTLLRRKKAVFG